MTIVNVLKIPNQIQFGLEKSLTKYSVEYYSELSVEQQNIARIANAVQVTICLLVSTSVF